MTTRDRSSSLYSLALFGAMLTAPACGVGTSNGLANCKSTNTCQTATSYDGTTQTCTYSNQADGTACDDGSVCTQTDTCLAGVCAGASSLSCSGGSDACHPGLCDPKSGCYVANMGGPCSPGIGNIALAGCTAFDYWAAVTIGDTQTFQVLIDTGSSTLAVAASDCSNCTGVRPTYSPGSSASDQGVTSSAAYGDQTGWEGEVFKDNVSVASPPGDVRMALAAITWQDNSFFVAESCVLSGTQTNQTQGILGMAFAQATFSNTDAFMDKLASTSLITNNAFAVQLCDIGGSLWIGGYDPTYLSSIPQFTPLVSDEGLYGVSMTDLQVNGTSLGYSTNDFGVVTVDTGTSIGLFPTPVFNALSSALAKSTAYKQYFGSNFLTGTNCVSQPTLTRAQVDAVLPTLTMMFPTAGSSSTFTLALPASQSYLQVYQDTSGTVFYCPGAASADITILGGSFMHGLVTIFDRGNSQLGFAFSDVCDT